MPQDEGVIAFLKGLLSGGSPEPEPTPPVEGVGGMSNEEIAALRAQLEAENPLPAPSPTPSPTPVAPPTGQAEIDDQLAELVKRREALGGR